MPNDIQVVLSFDSTRDAADFLAARSVRDSGCCSAPAVQPVQPVQTSGQILIDMLSDPRYEFRSVASLCDKSGLTGNELFAWLDGAGLDGNYITKIRRSDGATLVGRD